MAAHYLRPSKTVSSPTAMVSVGYSLRRIPSGCGDTVLGRFVLDGACLIATVRDGNDYIEVNRVHVLRSDELLGALQSLLLPGRTTWVWTTHMHRLLSCAGWYTALETGEWSIGGTRRAGVDMDGKPLKSPWKGYLNHGERSFAALAFHAGSGNVALLCDTRNYDVEPGECNGSEVNRAECVSSWCVGIATVMASARIATLRPTAAGTAIAAFTTGHISGPILCHQNGEVASHERQSYWPGRCECFRIGVTNGPIYHVDITSAYPACTLGANLPTHLKRYWRENAPPADSLLADGWLTIANVRVRSLRRALPSHHNGRTVWPVGAFWTTICGPELADAYTNGEVIDQGAVAIYSGYPALDSWSQYWLKLRDRPDVVANPYLRGAVKCITNRLYGCLSRRTRQWKRCDCNPPRAAFDQWYQEPRRPGHDCSKYLDELRQHDLYDESVGCTATQWRSVAWQVEYMTAPEDHADACVAISSWVSSLARVRLFKLLACATLHNTIYCDTDSLYTNQAGFNSLAEAGYLDAVGPGSCRLVSVYPSMLVRSPKNYDVGTTAVHAGSPANAVIDSDGVYTWDECESVYSAMRRQIAPSGSVAGRTRRLPDAWLPGTYGSDGTVYPVYLGE